MAYTTALRAILVVLCFWATQKVTAQTYAASAVIPTELRSLRHLFIDTASNPLAAEGGSRSVRILVHKEQSDTVRVVSNTATNHGISFSADGKTLFTSSLGSVTAYYYNATAGTVGTGKVIISACPTRAVTRHGRSSHRIPAPIMIKAFCISRAMSTAIDYVSGGEVLSWGPRNVVGMGRDLVYGGVWSVENSMDDVRLNSKDVHNENSIEKLNYHGILNDTNNKYKGANFGYPSCVAAWDTQLLGVSSLQVGSLFKSDSIPQASDCAQREPGRLHFHSHLAPLDVKFNSNATSVYIAFHGSWDRNPADGYRVMRVDFKNGQPVADQTSKTAQIPVIENSNIGACPNSCFRPVGLDFDVKGRLYMSSDSLGEVYKLHITLATGSDPPREPYHKINLLPPILRKARKLTRLRYVSYF
ncbi:hypothetical protein BR93DRAFT_986040 [Coniochaeta sp. PMI_546]|nr:hypothetical protein BR93DRAFT_986040 [Coniochaeta sp. PMI_546]